MTAINKPGTIGEVELHFQAEVITRWAVERIGNGAAVNLTSAPKIVKDAAQRLLASGRLEGDLKRCWT